MLRIKFWCLMRVVKGVLKFWVLRIIDGENQLWTPKNKGYWLGSEKKSLAQKNLHCFPGRSRGKGRNFPSLKFWRILKISLYSEKMCEKYVCEYTEKWKKWFFCISNQLKKLKSAEAKMWYFEGAKISAQIYWNFWRLAVKWRRK